MSNFTFLKNEWSSLFRSASKAESWVNTEPKASAHQGRLALEECVDRIYQMEYLEKPYHADLYNLVNNEEFKSLLAPHHLNGLKVIRITGNNGAHYGKRVTAQDAEVSLKYLFDFLKYFATQYSEEYPELPHRFDNTLFPKAGAAERKLRDLQAQIEKEKAAFEAQLAAHQKEKEAALAKAQESELALTNYQAKEAEAKAKLQAQKQQRPAPTTSEYTEAQTRQHLIDISLKEAGWEKLRKGIELEYHVQGMPITNDNPKGNGYVDYVLWDDNGKPLALVEAKRSSKDAEVGKHQAFLYANCLEKMHGQRPVIFYTNGYENFVWDDTFYSAPRRVYGFYTQEELRWKIQQRTGRKDIRTATVNPDIAGRPYQMEAIQRVAEAMVVDSKDGLRGNKREVLLVMATGSGKTRTAAALVDILTQYQWAKRVLFLADRNALVTQAKGRFSEFLEDLSSIDLTKDKENDTTRLVFSTYPTMVNQIDKGRKEGDLFYGVGHFDLIIVDEAHRSIYNRYKAIFEYFDAMIVGLTATPKDSIDHNTFELFGCGNEDPTFNYTLEEAVPTYLKYFENINVATKFIREGIKYSELSDAEKEKYEKTFGDATTGLFPEEIASNAMNKWLFNIDTVNKVLENVMTNGLKVEGGDEMGRTIIFAVNQKHADFIVECFVKLFPEKPAGYIATIHNKVSHAQSLIDDFCDEYTEKNPRIAVSVDMMDTGIDAPRVLNLVFFKVVRSYAKFWQMIGRGTRLCPDAFGPDAPKEHFIVFDVCQNFEFFNVNTKGKEGNPAKPVTQQIFEARIQLSRLLAETGELENIELANGILDQLHEVIVGLNKDRFQVQMHLRYVDLFKNREKWNNLSADDVHLIEEHLSALPTPEKVHEKTRRFDLMMLKMQIADLLEHRNREKYQERLIGIATELGKIFTVPQVAESRVLIEQLKDPDFYQDLSQKKLDQVREEIRDLMQYLKTEGIKTIYSNFQDDVATYEPSQQVESVTSSIIYKTRVERFIRENKNQIAINKLLKNKQITVNELDQLEGLLFNGNERGTKEDFVNAYGEQPLGKFIRSILGLEVEAANTAFAEFLQAGNLRADQMTFLQNIINFLNKNGTIDPKMLFESPFTDIHDQGIMGIFDQGDAGKIINIIKGINGNAELG